jgi:hypothetical protein
MNFECIARSNMTAEILKTLDNLEIQLYEMSQSAPFVENPTSDSKI